MTKKRPEGKRRARQRPAWIARLAAAARAAAPWVKAYFQSPRKFQVLIVLVALFMAWFTVNWVYQVIQKPTELFFPVSNTLYKSPRETWTKYGATFRAHSTAVVAPDLLAALAQVEGAGNPVARTYWRWQLTSNVFDIYKPASSAVGMYQITDGTFDDARKLCIHHHEVVDDGPWYSWGSCWFNWLYSRVVPSHAVEMTSAYLDRRVSRMLASGKVTTATLQQKQNMAAMIHLCGGGAAATYVLRGLRAVPNQKCGDHSLKSYVEKVNSLRAVFARLAMEE